MISMSLIPTHSLKPFDENEKKMNFFCQDQNFDYIHQLVFFWNNYLFLCLITSDNILLIFKASIALNIGDLKLK